MRSRRLDLPSTLVGLGVGASILVLTSLATPTPPVKTLRISLDPDASSIVRISEGETFKVPQKLRLVLKAAGSTAGGFGSIDVQINGETVFGSFGAGPELGAFAFPLVAQPEDVVSVLDPSGDPNVEPFVSGYLSE